MARAKKVEETPMDASIQNLETILGPLRLSRRFKQQSADMFQRVVPRTVDHVVGRRKARVPNAWPMQHCNLSAFVQLAK
jgi:elongation factor P--beta-lysine ligase